MCSTPTLLSAGLKLTSRIASVRTLSELFSRGRRSMPMTSTVKRR
jgi:hypothetical protein